MSVGISLGLGTNHLFASLAASPSFLLDLSTASQPAFAYGTKKLSKETSVCMRVRRTVGGDEKDIGFDSQGNVDSNALIDFGGYNLVQYSEDFSNVVWNDTAFTVNTTSNATTAPDGTNTADLLTDNRSSGAPSLTFQSVTLVSSSSSRTFNCSIYLKQESSQQTTFNCYVPGNTESNAVINWSLLTTNLGTLEDVGSGWYRLNYDITVPANATSIAFRVWPENRSAPTRTGGVYAWGAQCTEGSGVKDYQVRTNNPASNLTVARWYDQTVYNLLSDTEDFSAWQQTATSVTAQTGTSPTGNTFYAVEEGDLGVIRAHNVIKGVNTNLQATTGDTYTFSVYAKAGVRDYVTLQIIVNGSGVGKKITFNLNTGVVEDAINGTTGTIEDAGNGFYRCSATATFTETFTSNSIKVSILTNDVADTSNGKVGIAGEAIYITGAQLVRGAVTLPYVQGDTYVVRDATQSTASVQPKVYDVATGVIVDDLGNTSIEFDGVGDNLLGSVGYGESVFNLYTVITPNDTVFTFPMGDAGGKYSFFAHQGSTGQLINANYGTPTLYINNQSSNPTTKNDVYTLLGSTTNSKLVTHYGASTNAWTQLNFGEFVGGSLAKFKGKCSMITAYIANQTEQERSSVTSTLNKTYRVY